MVSVLADDGGRMLQMTPSGESRDVRLRIASYTVPCRNIAFAFKRRDSMRVSQVEHPGWARLYARVLQTGEVRVGDEVVVDLSV